MRLTEICEMNGKKYIRIKGTKALYADKERDGAPASNAIVRLATYEDAGEQGRLVSVVRCKECANKFDWPWCGMFPDDGYCSAGVRMDGDGNELR